ncbi:Magnesium transporters: CorA family [Klebsormidium nitens]|uniref:Magnesium transporter n=1 Tax=Klebsormidium nitens TaxID=105231 RepID=A0A1Y1IPV3_KLENI|nr:Magnesium transporters: CorA family [Klebsormidium nitens]|eukprot:GAQ92890.1 Magnesium transporters: CorA family [Klebsormidium nitens]
MTSCCTLCRGTTLTPFIRQDWAPCQSARPALAFRLQCKLRPNLPWVRKKHSDVGCAREVPIGLRRSQPRAFSGSLGALASDDDDEDSEALEVTRVRSRPRSVQDLDELTPAARERIAQFVKDDCNLTSTSYLGESEDESTLSENGRGNGQHSDFLEGTSSAKELGYQVLEINSAGKLKTRDISRRQLLRSTGLRPRDVRRIDPLLWVTNSLPAILVRNQAILLNLGSLRAIATPEHCLVFDHTSVGAAAFLEVFTARLAASHSQGGLPIPFELEVVEAALISRTTRLEAALMEVEPRVAMLLELLPNKLTADALEELRLAKQALVELGSKAGALRQMLLELLEDSDRIRRMTAMGRLCRSHRAAGVLECDPAFDEAEAEEEEEEVETLLEYYLQRCDSCHGQAEKLLDSAKEMEDSIAVNLSSRRLEVNRLELLLAIGTFACAVGAMVAGIFGMNLTSYLETQKHAFWITAGGIKDPLACRLEPEGHIVCHWTWERRGHRSLVARTYTDRAICSSIACKVSASSFKLMGLARCLQTSTHWH